MSWVVQDATGMRGHPSLPHQFSSHRDMATIQAKPSYSANEKTEEVDHLLYPLLKEGGGTWELSGDSKGLERTFKFKTFRTTWVRAHLTEHGGCKSHC